MPADAPSYAPYPRGLGPRAALGVIMMRSGSKINSIVLFVIMVIILTVRWHVIHDYSIDRFEDAGLCITAALSLLLSLYNLMKGSAK